MRRYGPINDTSRVVLPVSRAVTKHERASPPKCMHNVAERVDADAIKRAALWQPLPTRDSYLIEIDPNGWLWTGRPMGR